MLNDKETFITFTETDEFDKNQKLQSSLYPNSKKEYSLLELCCYYGSVDCFKLLITKFHSEITQTCLQLSFLGRNADIMSECLKYQEPNEDCMIYAIASHNIDFVTFLMNEYKHIRINLFDCCYYNNLESFLIYFDQTNDVKNCFICSPLFNIPYLCKYFLSHGANINENGIFGKAALHIAANNNSKEIVELIISHGANINIKDKNGRITLHYSAINNSKDTAEVLISHGANINEKDKDGDTALHFAAVNNHREIAELLISHGANINEKDKDGDTALHFAAVNNHKEIAELLISHGAIIDEKDKCEKTALHFAAFNNFKEIVELLISYGANINEKDLFGQTVLHTAANNNYKEIAEVLLSHGANTM